jgi:hypothetical protein
MLTSTTGYASTNIAPASAGVVTQYCNGSRVPPEITALLCNGPSGFANAPGCIQPGTVGIQVPPGVPDSIPPPLPVFTLTPAATVDEGSNWINMFYGPLSSVNPTILSGATGYGAPIGNYSLAAGSAAIDQVPISQAHPSLDYFGHPRPDAANPTHFDIGAVEYVSSGPALQPATVNPTSLTFGGTNVGSTSAAQTVTLTNPVGNPTMTGLTFTFTGNFARATGGAAGSCTGSLASTAGTNTCTVGVVFAPTGAVPPSVRAGTLTIGTTSTVPPPAAVTLSGTAAAVPLQPLTVVANFQAFGAVTRGSVGNIHTVLTVTNPATNPAATTLAFAVVPTNAGTTAAYWTQVPNAGAGGTNCMSLVPANTLAPGASCIARYEFTPPAAGAGGTTGAKAANITPSALPAGVTPSVPAFVSVTGTAN